MKQLWEFFTQQKWHSIDHRGVGYAARSSSNRHHTSKEGYKTIKQQWISALTSQDHISGADRYPKLVILLEIWELFLEERTYCVDQRGTGYAGRDWPNHSYIYKDGYEIAKQQWISAIMTKAHISWSDLVPKLIILLEIWGLFLVARTLYLP